MVIRAAGTAAVSCPALTKVVTSGLPFQVTWLPLVKPVPLTVRVNGEVPATAEFGDRLVSVAAALMVKVTEGGEVCPESTTVTDAVPADAISAAGTAAVSWPALTKVVTRPLAFQVTCVVLVKPAPFTVRVKAGPPAVALCGEMLVIDSAVVMVKVRGAGCGIALMVTDAVPADAMRAAGTAAVSCPALTKVVTSGLPFQVT